MLYAHRVTRSLANAAQEALRNNTTRWRRRRSRVSFIMKSFTSDPERAAQRKPACALDQNVKRRFDPAIPLCKRLVPRYNACG